MHNVEQFMENIFMSVIESKLAFFEVEVEKVFADAPTFGETGFRSAPETLNAVDMPSTRKRKNIVAMDDSVVFPIPQIHESVIAAPPIGVDNAPGIHVPADNALQGALFRVRDDFSINPAISLENAEDNGLRSCAAASLTFDALGAEVGLVHLDDTAQRSLPFTEPGNALSYRREIAVDSIPVDAGKVRRLCGLKVERKEPDEAPELTL